MPEVTCTLECGHILMWEYTPETRSADLPWVGRVVHCPECQGDRKITGRDPEQWDRIYHMSGTEAEDILRGYNELSPNSYRISDSKVEDICRVHDELTPGIVREWCLHGWQNREEHEQWLDRASAYELGHWILTWRAQGKTPSDLG